MDKEQKVPEMVSVPKEDFEAIKTKLAMLEAVADKGRMANWMAKTGKPLVRTVKVSKYNDKLVVAWRMQLDEVYKDSDNVWHEKQIVEITLQDDTKVSLDYTDFQRKLVKFPAEIIDRLSSNKPDYDKGTTTAIESFKVKLSDTGEVVTLDGAFIN